MNSNIYLKNVKTENARKSLSNQIQTVQKLKHWLNTQDMLQFKTVCTCPELNHEKTIKTMSSKDKADRNRSYGLQSPRSATLHK